ncbi:helix-turn-helix transcriptional regulator [Halomonas llamarensis]|uniref:AraC family transcriptional regulator n=1 Tax=Halomonas llamarensis TaxID=2945104 RepID=A0ABT0SRQ1_9GAMM|nr:AraC family transcriptional regulator [Halomonas llamarensis]MCL7930507.1 AraC family transcriptional regulator [Halomonas llamarensis]
MPIYSSFDAKAEIDVSTLLAPGMGSSLPVAQEDTCTLLRRTLQEGVDIVVWKGRLTRPLEFDIHDDDHRISFSCSLAGSSQSRFDDGASPLIHTLQEKEASISFHPGRHGTFTQAGQFDSITIMVRPDILEGWFCDTGAIPLNITGEDCFLTRGACNAELRTTAQMLSQGLCATQAFAGSSSDRPPLWLLGQCLVMVSLIQEGNAHSDPYSDRIPWRDQQHLLRARDFLLHDLSAAPTLPELAQEAGLSLLKLKRGFRQLFGNTVYGLFQQERMQEARRLLNLGLPVLVVAAELGYTNASHFAAAFKKQFGINPSEVKRQRLGAIFKVEH